MRGGLVGFYTMTRALGWRENAAREEHKTRDNGNEGTPTRSVEPLGGSCHSQYDADCDRKKMNHWTATQNHLVMTEQTHVKERLGPHIRTHLEQLYDDY